MTNETIDLIIEWFGHIKQIATDGKTLTGVVMTRQHCLDEIAAMASRCEQFVEKYRNEQNTINYDELDKMAEAYAEEFELPADVKYACKKDFKAGFKVCYRKLKE